MRDIEDYTKKYIKANFEDYQVKYRRRKLLEILDCYKPDSVLEIGCGMEPLFRYVDWDYHLWAIVEPSSLFYENAQKIVGKMEKDNRVLLYNEPFPTNSINELHFDFIICSGLLHEVENSEKFLSEIANICSIGTMLHLNVPNANSLHRIIGKGMNLVNDVHELSDRNVHLQQHKVFDMKLLETEVTDAGFSICESGSYFIKPFTHSQMYRMIENNIIGEEVLDGLYAVSNDFKEYGSEIYINAKFEL